MPVQKIIAVNVAPHGVNALKAARRTEFTEHDFLNHFCRGLRPAVIFVNTHALAARAVDDLIFAVDVWRSQTADQQRHGERIGVCRGQGVRGHR